MIAALLVAWGLVGCSSTCGPIDDVAIGDGAYVQASAADASSATSSPATPFAPPETPEPGAQLAELELAGDVVTVSYVDEQGRAVVATYRVVGSSLAP